ncbi:glutamate ABC transporter substrate-binding protein [Paenibacillus hunanensis]|uniref:glutamate ABC transporter substrate-binding protein n=1 Tax=Paenibacillus hunanensis TaxID=539262 RepID=UPI002026AD1A|nr:glutamate ABC transporter substrate-binding protein [Paenibacillus hunanensis]MCL9659301.1 glutamate ABC transporter substrate-binding protein [Paenibacillus hunanensis]WPP40335.1 glutamate ABC transporter substrate-binding protein [Paenibacillus hunanensis]
MMNKKRFSLLLVCMIALVTVLGACSTTTAPSASNGAGGADSASSQLDQIKQRGKLIVGVKYDTKLFGLKDPSSGNVEGFDVDMAHALAKSILGDESKVELKEVTSKTRIPMLNNGDIDMVIATMTITDERKKEVDFSDVYFQAGQSLLVKKGSPIKGIEDVTADTTILAAKGATSIKNIEEKVPNVKVLEYDNYQDAFNALKAGQGDALTTDDAILYGMAAQDPNYEVVGKPFTDEPYGIAVKKGQTALVEAINKGLTDMKADGSYNELYKKWIGKEPESK